MYDVTVRWLGCIDVHLDSIEWTDTGQSIELSLSAKCSVADYLSSSVAQFWSVPRFWHRQVQKIRNASKRCNGRSCPTPVNYLFFCFPRILCRTFCNAISWRSVAFSSVIGPWTQSALRHKGEIRPLCSCFQQRS